MISGCVRIACSSLIITSLLQVVNRLTDLLQVVNCTQAWRKLFHQLAASLQISSCSESDVHRLDDATWWSQQAWYNRWQIASAGKIYNLHQVCGVFGCVYALSEVLDATWGHFIFLSLVKIASTKLLKWNGCVLKRSSCKKGNVLPTCCPCTIWATGQLPPPPPPVAPESLWQYWSNLRLRRKTLLFTVVLSLASICL